MIDAIIDTILYRIPWWVYAGLALIVVGIIWRIFGWKGALAGLAAALAIFGYQKGMQQGYRDREAKGKRETDNAIREANAARADADKRNADPGELRKDDGFQRRDD